MLSQILRHEVEAYATHLLDHSPLLRRAQAGELLPESVGYYLEGIRYITSESVRLLHFAAGCSEGRGLTQLARHFSWKAAEESGHDSWAESDMRKLERHFDIQLSPSPSPALRTLTAFLAQRIEANPAHFMAYLYLVEHITVLLGPVWMEALESKCGHCRSHLNVVKKHVELDVAHVEEELHELDSLASESDLEGMRSIICTARGHIDDFFAEVATYTLAA